MRCAEVQDLLAEGHSALYFNAPNALRMSPYVDEVDNHAEKCPNCSLVLIRLVRSGFWRRPGPLHWLRVRRTVNRVRHWVNLAEQGPIAEEAPIVRVANVIIQQGIKENATEILLERIPTSERPPKVANAGPTSPSPSPPDQPLNLLEAIRRDIAHIEAAQAERTGLFAQVSYRVAGTWRVVMTMPDYIAPPLWVRFKSMADLLVAVEDEPQQGTILIRYENRNYAVHVSTRQGDHGETLLMAIAPE